LIENILKREELLLKRDLKLMVIHHYLFKIY